MPSPLDDPQASSPSLESRADPIDSSSSVPVPPELSSSSSAPLAIDDKPAAQPVGEEESVKDDGDEVHVLDVGEENVVKLDKLGPMIINTDGTLSRIQNWLDLTPFEQERTVRLLVKKRNLVRLQKLDQENRSQTQGEEPLSALKEASKETELER